MFSTKSFAILLCSLAALLPLTANAGSTLPVFVDCNAGGSIQSELVAGNTYVNFTGTCNELVSIQNDDTTIQGTGGDPAQSVVTFAVVALGVQRVSLDSFTINGSLGVQDGAEISLRNMTLSGGADIGNTANVSIINSTVTGSRDFSLFGNADLLMIDSTVDNLSGGIFMVNGANALFARTEITNTNNGLFVGRNSSLLFRDGRMGPALVDDANLSCNPLCAADGASIRLNNVVIEGTNNDPGIGGAVSVSRNVTLTLRGDNVIANDGSQPAVGVFNDSSFRQDRSGGTGTSQINGDVQVFGMSYADLRAAAITGNVEVDLRSTFRLGSAGFGGDPANTVLTGDSTVGRDSAFVIEDPRVTINGKITCLDRKSSLSGSFAGAGKIKRCTNFNGKKVKRNRN